ncbi:MAG: alpha/beta fold hydrolase [Blastocatellales bacterium]
MKAIRIILATLILTVLIAGSGHGQASLQKAGLGKPAVTERTIPIGDYRFHYKDWGAGDPVLVMDAGLCQSLDTWGDVPEKVAAFTRVFTYDRAGLGSSSRILPPGVEKTASPPDMRTSGQMVEELRALLRNAGVPAPYVLVGHSFGGVNVRLFARKYPNEVAGIVLIDGSNEEQYSRFAITMPEKQREDFGHFNRGANCEYVNLEASAAQLSEAPSLPLIPITVLTAASGNKPENVITHFELQADLARQAPNSIHLVAQRSGHFIQRDRPDAVIAAIGNVVKQARPYPIPLPTEEDLKQARILNITIPSEVYLSGAALALSGLVGWRLRKRKRADKPEPNRAQRRQAMRKEKGEKSDQPKSVRTKM